MRTVKLNTEQKRILLILLLALLLILSILIIRQVNISRDKQDLKHDQEPRLINSNEGSYVKLDYDELAKKSDLVAKGRVTSKEEKKFSNNPETSNDDLEKESIIDGTYLEYRFKIDEILKSREGDFSQQEIEIVQTLTIVNLDGTKSTILQDSELALSEQQQFVLFLDQGKTIYRNKYFTQGIQGAGLLVGNTIDFRDGRSITLTELREIISGLQN